MGVVLSLCDLTGNMVRPWAESGYECWCIDTQHRGDIVRDGIRYIECDVRRFLPPKQTEIVFAFPPCTHLASSGARWFKEKGLYGLADALEIVARCAEICEWSESPYLLENPVGTLATYWRRPDYTFQPWNFGDLESKKTCLWTGGGFTMPQSEFLEKPEGVRETVRKMKWLRTNLSFRPNARSETPPGFARAVFEANCEVSQCR